MALFGFVTAKEYNKLQAELETIKANFAPFERWQLETAEVEKWNPPDLSRFESQANLYRRLSSVFTAIDIVASGAALTPFAVKRIIRGKEPKDIPGHEFEMLLENPNPLDSRYDFLYATVAFWKLNRNAYWWINRADEFSPPEEIWFIPPHMIIPVPDEKLFLRGYLYYPGNGSELFLPPHEIVHFKGFNPFSRFIGLSAAIESLMLLAESYLGMMTWQSKVYRQSNGRLPSLMTFEQMIGDPQWDKIKRDTKEAAQNRDIMMLRGVGQGGVNWIQNTSSQKDMDFFAGLDAIDKKIMDTLAPGAYTMLYENANEANSRTGRATLNELAIYPAHVMMAQRITNGILPAYGSDQARPLKGEFEDVRVTDRQLELAEMQEYSKTHTIAEIREKYWSDDPIGDDRDELLPEQIKQGEGSMQDPEPPAVTAATVPQPAREMASTTNEAPAEQPAQKSSEILDGLAKYERYALRKWKDRKLSDRFTNPTLPAETLDQIHRRLQLCESEAAVKSVFETARGKVQPEPKVETKTDDTALVTLAGAINAMAAEMRNQTQTAFTVEAIKAMIAGNGHAPSVNVTPVIQIPPGEQHLHVDTTQGAPNVYNTFPIQVDAAKAPDIQVDSPVYVNQTIEPGRVPEITVPLKIENLIEQPAAPAVTITANLPSPPAASVTFAPVIQPSDVAIQVTNEVQPAAVENNITVQPAEVVIPGKVEKPEKKNVKIEIERGPDGKLTGATGTIEEEK